MTWEDSDTYAMAEDLEKKMQSASAAIEEVLLTSQRTDSLTVGVYESAKLMNVDPDRVVLCLLAADPEHENDIALKIHFTLIQAFCCDNDINIVRLSGLQRLSEIIGSKTEASSEPQDLHCILVSNPNADSRKCSSLEEIFRYCAECRRRNQWVPFIPLMEQ
ncbi:growth arrest and DNA damage-inducible protein GADD45 beta [Bombina bombina]|uniref:growth arrest and DNA damage-inducible protein GADD45 beta n=1 Tax=Bombina bombina TaxID=8345 RepID=UPI00235ABF1C|nr:growth arrest and DNA damage-inducible protein GADD45 beta [Bombina bombina]